MVHRTHEKNFGLKDLIPNIVSMIKITKKLFFLAAKTFYFLRTKNLNSATTQKTPIFGQNLAIFFVFWPELGRAASTGFLKQKGTPINGVIDSIFFRIRQKYCCCWAVGPIWAIRQRPV